MQYTFMIKNKPLRKVRTEGNRKLYSSDKQQHKPNSDILKVFPLKLGIRGLLPLVFNPEPQFPAKKIRKGRNIKSIGSDRMRENCYCL